MKTSLVLSVFSIMFYSSIVAQEKVITLSLKHNDRPIQANFYFDKVEDARTNKEYVGQAQKGMVNKKVPVISKLPLEDEIKLYLNTLVPPNSNKRALTMIIHQLWVSEKTTMTSEKGMMEISIEIIESDRSQEGTYGLFNHYIEQGGMDVTGKHERRIREGLQHCINQFISSPRLLMTEVNKVKELDFKNGIPAELKVGFYANYASLKSNTPIDEEIPEVKVAKVNDHVSRYTLKSQSDKKRFKHFAYYSGDKLLLNTFSLGLSATHFLENKTVGQNIVFVDKYSRPGAGIAFGALGAAASTKTRASILNMNTGLVKEVDDQYMNELLADHPELLKEYHFSEKNVEDQINMVQKLNDRIRAAVD